jgi:hypothetical protein
MSTAAWIAIAVVAAIIVVVLVAAFMLSSRRRHRRERLQERFGREYDRAVDASDNPRAAEQELQARADRRDQLELHDLEPSQREIFRGRWVGIQTSFVDDPARALAAAGNLLEDAMKERGYPNGGTQDRIDLISVDHPDIVPEYRRADETGTRGRTGAANTEELRQALLSYRAVFERVVQPERAEASR